MITDFVESASAGHIVHRWHRFPQGTACHQGRTSVRAPLVSVVGCSAPAEKRAVVAQRYLGLDSPVLRAGRAHHTRLSARLGLSDNRLELRKLARFVDQAQQGCAIRIHWPNTL